MRRTVYSAKGPLSIVGDCHDTYIDVELMAVTSGATSPLGAVTHTQSQLITCIGITSIVLPVPPLKSTQ